MRSLTGFSMEWFSCCNSSGSFVTGSSGVPFAISGMKSNNADTELGLGIIVVGTFLSCWIKGISIWPFVLWIVLVFAALPALDKFVLAESFQSTPVRWLIKVALFLAITAFCLNL